MLTPDVLQAALVFLDRCPLQGAEATSFLRVRAALEAEIHLGAQQPAAEPNSDARYQPSWSADAEAKKEAKA